MAEGGGVKERTIAENASVELLPCRKCGSTNISLWDGLGTQAEMSCEECGEEEGIQVTDILSYEERFAPGNEFSMEKLSYPQSIVEKAKKELVKEWNTRAPAKPEWKTIDSAPKDGRTIICATIAEEPFMGKYVNDRWCMIGRPQGSCGPGIVDLKNNLPCDATHWMEMPKPPEEKK